MTQQWLETLTAAGARIENQRVIDWGDPAGEARAATERDVLIDLSHYAVVRISGADARDFLQNQFTNDVRQVDAGHGQLSAYCSPKGRMLARFELLQRGDDLLMVLPQVLADETVNRLRKYVLMSKVTLESAELVGLGLSGPDAIALLTDAVGRVPESVGECVTDGDVTVMRLEGPFPRFQLFMPPESRNAIWENLSVRTQHAGADAWELLSIRAGIPEVYPETSEAFVPQMVNLQVIEAVSFRKGCYPGQEVVARMQYLGKLKRRMYRARTTDEAFPGNELFSAAAGGGQGAGKVVRAATAPDGGRELLAVLQIAAAESGEPVHLGGEDGAVLELLDLPYPFPAAEDEQS